MIKQLAHLCIHTQDLDETLRFYTGALGLKVVFEFERQGSLFGYYLGLGNQTFIEVFQGNPGEVGNINHMALEVDDMDDLMARLRDHGIECEDKKLGADHSWQLWATDPNGVRIEFHQYTPESMQLVGGKCIVDW